MFDLNEEITGWRDNLAQSETLRESDIDELDSHLREEIKQLTASKLSEREAFWVATHRLGDTASLESEFGKTNGPYMVRNRLFWMTAGVLGYLLVTRFAGSVSEGCVLLAGISGLRGYSLGLIGIISKVLILAITLFLFYRAYRQDCNSPGLGKLVGSFKGKVILFTALAVFVIVLAVAQLFLPAMTVRMVSLKEYSQMALVSTWVQLVLPVLLPVILVIMLIKLRAPELRVRDIVSP
ncbi:MAG: hypothetical protein JSU70_22970 [Phycisphaerales bacterium]|nr:MAG: hypothetical protein JSU70_22970 [Phycisphaerales bacterium]